MCTTLTPTRSACPTVDVHGMRTTLFTLSWIVAKPAKVNVKIYLRNVLCSSYIGGSYSSCSVQIRVVKLSDAGDYHFRFETDQPLGRWTSPNTVRLDVTGISTQAETAESSALSASLPLAASIFPLRLSMSECAQTCRFRRTLPGPATCSAWERPCLSAVRPEVVLLQGGASRCTGVVDIQLSCWQCRENSAAVVLKVGASVFVNSTSGVYSHSA